MHVLEKEFTGLKNYSLTHLPKGHLVIVTTYYVYGYMNGKDSTEYLEINIFTLFSILQILAQFILPFLKHT